jgi:hypothetical protein
MEQDRRRFLKLFGVSTAAIAAAPAIANAEPIVEVLKAEAVSGLIPNYRLDMMDVRDEPLWSRLRVERNEMRESYSLFSGPDHSMREGLIDTNLDIPNALIQPEAYCIQKIGFVFSPSTIPVLRSAFIERYTLTVNLGRKRYWEAPLAMCFSIGEPDREKGFATLPDDGFMSLEIPLIIEAGLYFCLGVVGKPIHPCGKLTGWGVFKGLHAVGIQ